MSIADLSREHAPVGDLFEQPATPDAWLPFALTQDQIDHFNAQGYLSGIRILTDAQVDALTAELAELVNPQRLEAMEQQAEPLEQAGVPRETALWVAGLDALYGSLDLVEVSERCGVEMAQAARVYFSLGEELELDWLGERLAALPGQDRWHAGARAALRDDLDALQRGRQEPHRRQL